MRQEVSIRSEEASDRGRVRPRPDSPREKELFSAINHCGEMEEEGRAPEISSSFLPMDVRARFWPRRPPDKHPPIILLLAGWPQDVCGNTQQVSSEALAASPDVRFILTTIRLLKNRMAWLKQDEGSSPRVSGFLPYLIGAGCGSIVHYYKHQNTDIWRAFVFFRELTPHHAKRRDKDKLRWLRYCLPMQHRARLNSLSIQSHLHETFML